MGSPRPPFLGENGRPTPEWVANYGFNVWTPGGKLIEFPAFKQRGIPSLATYVPSPKQLDFHESTSPNCIIEGSRGTGKSGCIRMDAHMRALSCDHYTYLVIRRTMPELKKSHLKFIPFEMNAFGGSFHKTDNIAYYPNGSLGFFSHCETEDDMMKLLSSEYMTIYFDEITTFTWEMITKVSSCVRVAEDSGLLGLVRGGTNPIGVGAAEVRRYYIVKDITPEEDPDYIAEDFESIRTTLEDNPYIDRDQYIKRLKNLPDHVKRAWLDGEWVVEGAYFSDYKPRKKREDETWVDWHVVQDYPVIKAKHDSRSLESPYNWIQIYRAIDWGFSPDPACCLWIASLPNGRSFVMKEMTWRSTTARQVAKDIVRESDGYRVVESYCDPSMFFGDQATEMQSIGDIFENNGVMLTPSVNDRTAAGYAIHEFLNTILEDGKPQLQIYEPMCPMLCRTLGELRTDKRDPSKIADGNDHWAIALAYYCMGRTHTSRESLLAEVPRWMRPKPKPRRDRNN